MTRTAYYASLKDLAHRIRTEHGLKTGRVTLSDMRRIYKANQLKVKLWHQPLRNIRGAYVNDELGAEVMINGKLPVEQRIFTMAHELKHHLVDQDRAFQIEGPDDDPLEIGAEIFAAELIFPEANFAEELAAMGVTRENFTAEAIVRLKHETGTTLSFTALGKRAEFLGLAPKGALAKVAWKKLNEQLYGEPVYKRIQRYRAIKAARGI